MYATYLTIYKGNKLPPFYIGHAKLSNLENGYLGSVGSKEYKDIWLEEIKENRGLFKNVILKRFQTKAEALQHEEYIQLKFDVHKNPLYINRAVANRKFYCTSWGPRPHSDQTKNKLRVRNKEQFSDPEKRKRHLEGCIKSNASHSDKIWINNGEINKRVTPENYELNFSSWTKGRLFKEGQTKFFEHGNRKRDLKTGKFISQESI